MSKRKNIQNMFQGPPNPGFMQEKVRKGILSYVNPSKAWNAKLEVASFFCHLKTYTGSVKYLMKLNIS